MVGIGRRQPDDFTTRQQARPRALHVPYKSFGRLAAIQANPLQSSMLREKAREVVGDFTGADDAAIEAAGSLAGGEHRSEEHTSELQSLMRISYAVFCLKKKNTNDQQHRTNTHNYQIIT